MNTSIANKIGKRILKISAKYSPEILTGIGVVSIIGTAILAAKAVPKLQKANNIGKELIEDTENDPDLTPIERRSDIWEIRKSMYIRYAKALWKPALSGAVGIAAIIYANRKQHKTIVGLTSAYALTVQEFKDFKEAARELKLLNKNKEEKIRDKIAEKKVNKAVNSKQPIVLTGGDDLFIDDWSGQMFKGNSVDVEKACIELNHQMIREDRVTMNDFYYLIGIPEVPSGDLGFESVDGPLELIFGTALKDNKAYITVGFNREPMPF